MRKGYLLLEAMIAIVILGVILTSMLSSLSSVNKNLQISKSQAKSLALAEDLLENLRCEILVGSVSFPIGPTFTTGWVSLNAGTILALRDPSASAACRLTRADVDSRPAVNDLPGAARSSLYFADLRVEPAFEPENGASITIVLGRRGP